MLIEAPRRFKLLTASQCQPADFSRGDTELERKNDSITVFCWDEVAERWPNGGRFPSLIFSEPRV